MHSSVETVESTWGSADEEMWSPQGKLSEKLRALHVFDILYDPLSIRECSNNAASWQELNGEFRMVDLRFRKFSKPRVVPVPTVFSPLSCSDIVPLDIE